MPPTLAQIGYATLLGRQGAQITTIALAITANPVAQVVTPAAMTGIIVGSILMIDNSAPTVREPVVVTAITGTTFTAIFQNSHGTGSQVHPLITRLEIVKMAGPIEKMDMKEATNMLSPAGYKEYLAGLRDGGTITFEANYIPKDVTHADIRADFDNGVLSQWAITLPASPTAPSMGIWYFSAYAADLSPALPLDDRMSVTGTLKISGKPVLF